MATRQVNDMNQKTLLIALAANGLLAAASASYAAPLINSSDITLQGGAGTSNANDRTGVPSDVGTAETIETKPAATEPRIKAGTHLHKSTAHPLRKVDIHTDNETSIGNDYEDGSRR